MPYTRAFRSSTCQACVHLSVAAKLLSDEFASIVGADVVSPPRSRNGIAFARVATMCIVMSILLYHGLGIRDP